MTIFTAAATLAVLLSRGLFQFQRTNVKFLRIAVFGVSNEKVPVIENTTYDSVVVLAIFGIQRQNFGSNLKIIPEFFIFFGNFLLQLSLCILDLPFSNERNRKAFEYVTEIVVLRKKEPGILTHCHLPGLVGAWSKHLGIIEKRFIPIP